MNVFGEQILSLLKKDVIENSTSAWRHCPVITLKTGGGHRLTINYKSINEEIIFDSFPIPRIADLLSSGSGSHVFSLDFSQFHHQLPLVDTDKPKTAFYSLDDLWQFTRCPFGLKNAVTY
jgi:hypothetical protein